jgi:ubiquitin thioesterase protein OTUB1
VAGEVMSHVLPKYNSADSLHVAVAFGYFENLFNLRDTLRVHRELARIKSLNVLLDQVGHEEHLYEIFVDATEVIFSEILDAIQNGVRDDSFLVDAFNNEYNSNGTITHFRVSSNLLSAVMLRPFVDT